jgi:hypothetical protein
MASEGGWRPLQPPTRRHHVADPVGLSLTASPAVRLARTHAAAVAGDTCVTIALAGTLFFNISPSEARGKIALSLILTMAPFAVVAPFLGPFIDRHRGGRRRMVLASGAGRAVVAMVAAEAIHSVALFPLVFVLLVLAKAHGVAKSSLVRATVDDEADLVKANSRLAVLAALAGFVTAIPAGIILKLPFLGPGWVLRVAAVAFGAVALLSVALVDASGPPVDAPAVEPQRPAPRRLLAPGVLPAATAMAILRGVVGFLTFHVSFGFRRTGIATGWLGVVVGASAVGCLLGSFMAPHLRRWLREEALVLCSLLAVAAGGLWLWRQPGRLTTAALGLIVGVAASTARMAFDALVQRDNEEGAQGRVFARFEAIFQVVWVAGALLPVLATLELGWGGFIVMAAASGGGGIYAVELWARHAAGRNDAPHAAVVWPAPPPPTTQMPVQPTVEVPTSRRDER